MSAVVHEVTQYAARCAECQWDGEVHDDHEDWAIQDADQHNHEKHGGPKPAEESTP